MRIQRIRFEHFGGIIGTQAPVSLLWVDREFLRARGFHGGPKWEGEDPGLLSAPVEMEIAVTDRCNLACPCCYVGSSPAGRDVSAAAVLKALKIASRMGIFHVAFGGGEPLLHPRLLFLAHKARGMNLLPTLTTNGTLVTPSWAKRARDLFARVNVSVDLVGGPRDIRATFEASLGAAATLRDAGVISGVNFIVTSDNIQRLSALFEGARAAGADSVLLLRPKPSGRGRAVYRSVHPCAWQQRVLLPVLLELGDKYHLPFHLDCALTPLLLTCGVSGDVVDALGACGCIAGDLLVTVDVDGMVHPCSHLDLIVGPVEHLPRLWTEEGAWKGFRRRFLSLRDKCAACPVREKCRGGCAVVNQHYGLGLEEPDPDIACWVPPH
jgi:radical SAM protein with 4Fe4S-binding SPASM domain